MTNSHEAVFSWPHPEANEVIVTGTFDQWKETVRMQKGVSGFEAHVSIPWGQKTLYKFVVDGRWTLHDDQPTEVDPIGNVNNVYTAPPMPAEPKVPSEPPSSQPEPAALKEEATPAEPAGETTAVSDKPANGAVLVPDESSPSPTIETVPKPPGLENGHALQDGQDAKTESEDVIGKEPTPSTKDVAPVVPVEILPVAAVPEPPKDDTPKEQTDPIPQPTHPQESSSATSATAVSEGDASTLPPSTHTPAQPEIPKADPDSKTPERVVQPEPGADSESKPITVPVTVVAPPANTESNAIPAAEAKEVPKDAPSDDAKQSAPSEPPAVPEKTKASPSSPPSSPEKKKSTDTAPSPPRSPGKFRFPRHSSDGHDTVSTTSSKRKKRLSILDKVKGIFHQKDDKQ